MRISFDPDSESHDRLVFLRALIDNQLELERDTTEVVEQAKSAVIELVYKEGRNIIADNLRTSLKSKLKPRQIDWAIAELKHKGILRELGKKHFRYIS